MKRWPALLFATVMVTIALSSCYQTQDTPPLGPVGTGTGQPGFQASAELTHVTTASTAVSIAATRATQQNRRTTIPPVLYDRTTAGSRYQTTSPTPQSTASAPRKSMGAKPSGTSTASKPTAATKKPSPEIPLIEEKELVQIAEFPRAKYVTMVTRPPYPSKEERLQYYAQQLTQQKQVLQQQIELNASLQREIDKVTALLAESKRLLKESQDNQERARKAGDTGAYAAYLQSVNTRKEHVRYYETHLAALNSRLSEYKTALADIKSHIQWIENTIERIRNTTSTQKRQK